MKVIAKNGGYLIAFSESQTPEEWKLVQQAKELERKQKTAEYEQTVQNQPRLVGGVDWEKFRNSGKPSCSPEKQNPAPAESDDYQDLFNPDEWTEILGSFD